MSAGSPRISRATPARSTPILARADRLSLIQTALKLTVPGIPDIYQGCELGNLCADRPRQPARRWISSCARRALDDPACLARALDRDKLALTRTLLALRRSEPELFLEGDYQPLHAPEGICAFSRRHEGLALHVAAATARCGDLADDLLPAGRVIWPQSTDGTTGPVRIVLEGV